MNTKLDEGMGNIFRGYALEWDAGTETWGIPELEEYGFESAREAIRRINEIEGD